MVSRLRAGGTFPYVVEFGNGSTGWYNFDQLALVEEDKIIGLGSLVEILNPRDAVYHGRIGTVTTIDLVRKLYSVTFDDGASVQFYRKYLCPREFYKN